MVPSTSKRTALWSMSKVQWGCSPPSSVKEREKLIEEVEKLLHIWLENQQQWHVPLSLKLTQEKARLMFEDLKAKAGKSAVEETFCASHGWFAHFNKRANLHQVAMTRVAASAYKAAAKRFPQKLKKITKKEGYSAKQIFYVDRTGFFWKKMPKKPTLAMKRKPCPDLKQLKIS